MDLLGIIIADLLFTGLIFLYIGLTLWFRERRKKKGETGGDS